jgi:hypothetical protein
MRVLPPGVDPLVSGGRLAGWWRQYWGTFYKRFRGYVAVFLGHR